MSYSERAQALRGSQVEGEDGCCRQCGSDAAWRVMCFIE